MTQVDYSPARVLTDDSRQVIGRWPKAAWFDFRQNLALSLAYGLGLVVLG